MRHPNYHQDHNGLTAFTDIIPLKGTKKITKHLTVIAPLFFPPPPSSSPLPLDSLYLLTCPCGSPVVASVCSIASLGLSVCDCFSLRCWICKGKRQAERTASEADQCLQIESQHVLPKIIKIPETFPLNIVTFCSPACSSSCCLCTTRRPGGYCRARANNRLLYRLGRPKGRHPQFLGFKNGLLSVSYSGARALYAIMRQHLLWLAVGSHSDIFFHSAHCIRNTDSVSLRTLWIWY